jgi:hypothetical protein
MIVLARCGDEKEQAKSSSALQFARGDMLVLVTDGFLEWSNVHDEDFGGTVSKK